MTTSDPGGQLLVEVGQPDMLVRCRFALVAATMGTEGWWLGVVNVKTLDERELFARQPENMRYGAETVEDRETRRAKVWMPVEVRSG